MKQIILSGESLNSEPDRQGMDYIPCSLPQMGRRKKEDINNDSI